MFRLIFSFFLIKIFIIIVEGALLAEWLLNQRFCEIFHKFGSKIELKGLHRSVFQGIDLFYAHFLGVSGGVSVKMLSNDKDNG
jgi:hypothetical protein